MDFLVLTPPAAPKNNQPPRKHPNENFKQAPLKLTPDLEEDTYKPAKNSPSRTNPLPSSHSAPSSFTGEAVSNKNNISTSLNKVPSSKVENKKAKEEKTPSAEETTSTIAGRSTGTQTEPIIDSAKNAGQEKALGTQQQVPPESEQKGNETETKNPAAPAATTGENAQPASGAEGTTGTAPVEAPADANNDKSTDDKPENAENNAEKPKEQGHWDKHHYKWKVGGGLSLLAAGIAMKMTIVGAPIGLALSAVGLAGLAWAAINKMTEKKDDK